MTEERGERSGVVGRSVQTDRGFRVSPPSPPPRRAPGPAAAMAGVEDEDEFKDALGAAVPPPCSQSPKPASKSKPATGGGGGGGGLGRRLFASIPLPATLSAAIGRFSSPKPPASNVGLGLLLDAGAGLDPSADGPPASYDAAASGGGGSLHMPSFAALQRQHGDDQVAGRGAGAGLEELGLVPAEEEWGTTEDSREKVGLAVDVRSGNRNCFPTRGQEEEGEQCPGEQCPGDELGQPWPKIRRWWWSNKGAPRTVLLWWKMTVTTLTLQ